MEDLEQNGTRWNIKKHWTFQMKQVILNLWQENKTLPMIHQMQIMMKKMKLSVTQKYQNLTFVITRMLTL